MTWLIWSLHYHDGEWSGSSHSIQRRDNARAKLRSNEKDVLIEMIGKKRERGPNILMFYRLINSLKT